MTQKEFFDRTSVEVNAKEYAAIEEVYMDSDLDKDAFCEAWVKMNASRVAAAKEVAKQKKQEAVLKDKVLSLLYKLESIHWEDYAIQHLSKRQQALVESIGISLLETHTHTEKKVYSLKYDIKKYLGIE